LQRALLNRQRPAARRRRRIRSMGKLLQQANVAAAEIGDRLKALN
jgi:hypothetical protein